MSPLRYGPVILLSAMCGCGIRQLDEQDATEAAISRAKADWYKAHITQTCPPDAKPVQATCGLLATNLAPPEAFTEFAKRYCQPQDDARACTGRFVEMVLAQFEERYTKADPVKIGKQCKAHPDQCDAIASLEVLWLRSHNQGVDEGYKRRVKSIREEAEAEAIREDAAERARWAAAVKGMVEGMRQGSSGGRSCTRDSDCGYREVCLLPSGSSTGGCFKRAGN